MLFVHIWGYNWLMACMVLDLVLDLLALYAQLHLFLLGSILAKSGMDRTIGTGHFDIRRGAETGLDTWTG